MMRVGLAGLIIVAMSIASLAQSGGTFTLTSVTVSGGVTRMSGGVFAAAITTGQATQGVRAAGGNFSVVVESPPIFPVLPANTNVSVCGRAVTADGRGLNKARVTVTDQIGSIWQSLSSPQGEFCFADLPTGRVYSINAAAKHYTFQPYVISLADRVDGLSLIGTRDPD